jgi:hypothetical protein
MSTVEPLVATPVRDRNVTLMVFGILQILIGGFFGVSTLMLLILVTAGPSIAMPQNEVIQQNPQMMIPGLFSNLLISIAFIWLGIGSIRARRWAWTLTVVISWMWLIVGVISFIGFMLFARPMMQAAFEQQGMRQMPPGAMVVMHIFQGAILFGIYILLPLLFLTFYRQASVRATCQRRDPKVPWTDRCPMPVFALSLFLGFSVVSMLISIPTNRCNIPLFGYFAPGVIGIAVMVLMMLLFAYLAWGTYRLQKAAWWVTLLLWGAGTASTVVTFWQTTLLEIYEKMEMPANQLELIRKSGFAEISPSWIVGITLVSGIACLGYLLYVRRYFYHVDNAAIVSETL